MNMAKRDRVLLRLKWHERKVSKEAFFYEKTHEADYWRAKEASALFCRNSECLAFVALTNSVINL